MVVDISFVTQRLISQLQFALGGRCPWYASRAGSSSAVAVHLCGRLHPCRGAEFIPWSRQFVRPGIPQLLHMVADVPLHRSSRFTSPSWRRGRFLGPNCSFDHGHYTVAEHGGRCPCCAVLQFSSADVEETVELPQLQLVFLRGHCRSRTRRCAMTDAEWFRRHSCCDVARLMRPRRR